MIRLAWSLLVMALGGCPGVVVPLERPQVTVEDLAAVSHDPDTSLHLRMRLSVMNRNPEVMRARAIDWQLAFTGSPPVRGRNPLDVIVPARTSASFEVDIHIASVPAAAIVSQVRAGRREFRASGTVHHFSPRGDLGAVFDDAGQIRDDLPVVVPSGQGQGQGKEQGRERVQGSG